MAVGLTVNTSTSHAIRLNKHRLSEKWPLIHDTGNPPSAGRRIFILGGPGCIAKSNVAGDAYANDAIWRAMPLAFWDMALSWLQIMGATPPILAR